jgi:hypothetical protein
MALRVFPRLAELRRGKLPDVEYEDWLVLAIELDHAMTKAEKARLAKLYAGWCKRITAESLRADDDGGEDFTRFYPPSITDKLVQGGASRFIAAHESCAWLAGELAKVRGVVSVAFGEVPEAGAPIAQTATTDDTPPEDLAKLELVHEGVRKASLCFAITLYSDRALQKIPAAALAAWHEFLALVPPGRLHLWGTETTAPMNRRAVTQATLGTLDKWLAKAAPKREYLAFSIGDEATHQEAPRWAFDAWSHYADPEDAHFVHLAVPIRVGLERADAMAELARRLFATGAFRSGIAGPCWRCAPASSYDRVANGHFHAATLAPSYPGIDLVAVVADATCVGRDAIKNVGWLTLLDAGFVDELGGAKRLAKGLPKSVRIEPAGKGVMIRAGALPTLDATGGERAIVAKVAPLLARALPRLRWMSLPDHVATSTHAYALRLAPWPELELVRAHFGVATGLLAATRTDAIETTTRAALESWRAAVAALRGAVTTTPAVVDHPAVRAKLVADELRHLFTYLEYAGHALLTTGHPALALELFEAAVAIPAAPATLWGHLRIRQDPAYLLNGLLPAALAAGDRGALERHVAGAAERATANPELHHALARAFVALGDHPRALDHVELAQAAYADAKAMKTEPPLAPIAKDPRFIAAFKPKRKPKR